MIIPDVAPIELLRSSALRLRSILALFLVLSGCREHAHGESRKSEQEKPEKEHQDLYSVPVPTCTCVGGGSTVTLHAPKVGKVLWWFGVDRNSAVETDEVAIFSGRGQSVISPKGDARMLIACTGDLATNGVVALVRDRVAAAWSVAKVGDDASVVWAATLPDALDVTGIDQPLIGGTSAHVGCSQGNVTKAGLVISLRNGSRVTLSMVDGTVK